MKAATLTPKSQPSISDTSAINSNQQGIEPMSLFPDPFDQKTTIVYKLDRQSCVSLVVYNIEKNGMTYLVCGHQHEGYHKVDFDASHLPAGIYIARLRTDSGVVKRAMTKLGSKKTK